MRIDFRNIDFDALERAWNRFHPSKYAVDASILRYNTVESPVFDWGASCAQVNDDGEIAAFVIIKQPANRLYVGPDKDVFHLSAIGFCDPQTAVDLFASARDMLANRGASRIVFGMDSRHFFPGCPIDVPAITNYLTIEGFSAGGEAVDLERDLVDYVNPFPIPSEFQFRIASDVDIPAVDDFLRREFPGRWRYDSAQRIAAEGRPTVAYGMFDGTICEGFAILQDWTCKHPVAGGVWRADLGDHWGTLGPIGVAKHLRGNGAGNALLGKALEYQRDQGVRKCIIDWTGLVKFYGGHGFKVNRTYRSMSLRLDP